LAPFYFVPDIEAIQGDCRLKNNRSKNAAGRRYVFILLMQTTVAFPAWLVAAEEGIYRSPFDLAFSPNGKRVAVSDRTAGVLYIIEPSSDRAAKTIALQGKPSGVAWTPNGTIVVAEYDAGTVAEVDAASGKVVRRIRVGPKPIGVAVAAKRNLLIVCDYGLHFVSIVDLKSGKERKRIPAVRQPCFAAITPDGRTAVVGNLIPFGPANDPASAAIITLIDLETLEKTKDIALLEGSSNVRRIAISPDGKWAYVAHTRGNVALPTSQIERGWVNTNVMTLIDLEKKERFATVLLDYLTEGAADPWGVTLSADGKTAWVSLAGDHQIARLDLALLHQLLAGQVDVKTMGSLDPNSGSPAALWNQIKEDPSKRNMLAYHLGALYGANVISRHNVALQCPRGLDLAPDGKRLAVAGYYSGEMALLEPDTCKVAKKISLGPQPAPDAARRGEMVFHDAMHCFQHWLSCATCHPDARSDGLNWDLLNDGIGNPKNSRSLVWSHKTPPTMSIGIRESMEVAVQKGFQFIQFREVEQGDLEAVWAYLRSLEPERSPYLVNGRLGEKAAKGKRIFEDPKVGCARCHPAPLFTSLKMYDVGTKHEVDRNTEFDTPTCIELWRTAPYLHDGSAATLKELLTRFNPEDKHGVTSHLSNEQIEALVEYLLSL
jgi:DNA-binding beta-propeller fold protein YncE/mono/diheme cytochrome c family protein